jgi:PAS domain S-box-containing protein
MNSSTAGTLSMVALQTIDEGVLVFDAEGKVLLWNRALEELTGGKASVAAGASAESCLPMLSGDGRALVEAALRGGRGELKARPFEQAGVRRYFDIATRPVGGRGGVAVVRDVTEAVRAREKLDESEDRFRIMADCSPVLLWMAGRDSKCYFFNDVWLKFTGRPMEREVGVGWAEGVHAEDFEFCMETYMAAFSRREPFRMEYRLRRHDGEYRWLLDTGVPRFAADQFAGYIGSCIDITELRQSRERVERSLREKEVLLREVHHRVKNNLQIVSSLIGIASERADTDQSTALFRECLNRIDSIALAHEVTCDTSDAGRVPFSEYARRMATNLVASFNGHGPPVSLRFATEEVFLPLDRAVPAGLLLNELVSNSLKHAFPGGRGGVIEVGLRRDGREVSFWVRDDGVGLREPPRPVSSAGLGIARALSGQLDGRMTIGVEKGTQVEVRFELPLSESAS